MPTKSALRGFSDELVELVAGIQRCTVTLEGDEHDRQSSASGFVITSTDTW